MIPVAAPMAGEGAEQQVVGHRHAAEQFALFRHQHQAFGDQHIDRHLAQRRLALVLHLATRRQQAHQGRQQRGLAGAVGTDDGDDLAFADAQVDLVDGLDASVIDAQAGCFEQYRLHSSTPPR
jgi:hypothetical protein